MSKLSLGISLAALTDLRILYKLVCWLRGKYQIGWHNMNQYDTCFLKLKHTNTSDHGRWTHLKMHVTYVVFVFKLCDLEPSFHAKGMSHLSKMYLHKTTTVAHFFYTMPALQLTPVFSCKQRGGGENNFTEATTTELETSNCALQNDFTCAMLQVSWIRLIDTRCD